MLTTNAAAEKWGCSRQRVLQWLKEGRVRGAKRFGDQWIIPENAKRPAKRTRNGK